MGVKRAVDLVLDLARTKGGVKIYTYGPLIHNPQTVELLARRGVIPLASLEEAQKLPRGSTIVIRAHGITPEERKRLQAWGLTIVDATCPRVGRVQAIITKHARKGYLIAIVGDKAHPEVNGLLGYARGQGIVISGRDDIATLPTGRPLCVVAQTTQNIGEYETLVAAIKERFPDAVVHNTICDSTARRQREVEELARDMDLTVIVGGKNSANTRRLAAFATLGGKPSYHIETEQELPYDQLRQANNIGISAGASTPNWIITRVVDAITDARSRRTGWQHVLFTCWAWSVKTDLYSAFGAGILTLIVTLLQGIPPSWLTALIASLYVYAIHTLNRLMDRRASTVIGSFRRDLYRRHERAFLYTALMALLLSLALAAFRGWWTFLVLMGLAVAGLLYTAPLFPRHGHFRRLRDLPGSKNIFMALAWALVTAVIPSFGYTVPFARSLTAFIYVLALGFLRSVISDLEDAQSDKLVGRETIPVLLDFKTTLGMIHACALGSVIILSLAFVTQVTSSLSLFLTIAIFYLWIYAYLYVKKPELSGVVKEGLLETVYYVSGASTLLWMLWTQSSP